jgi:hypothetical protein
VRSHQATTVEAGLSTDFVTGSGGGRTTIGSLVPGGARPGFSTLFSVTTTTAPPAPTSAPTVAASSWLERALLACGIAYGVLTVVLNDVIAASSTDGYDRIDAAVSELSARGAPARGFLVATTPVMVGLLVAFGVGVWRAAGDRRSLRITGALIMVHGVSLLLWLLAPMSPREQIAAGEGGSNDLAHLGLTALTVSVIVAQMAFGAASFGRGFRVYTAISLAVVLVGGVLTGVLSGGIERGDPTPWMGVAERACIGAWLLWMASLAIVLLRRLEPVRA